MEGVLSKRRSTAIARRAVAVRARDVQAKQIVALKVFNAAEAFRRNSLAGCNTLEEARAEALRAFRFQVRALERLRVIEAWDRYV